MHIPFQVLENGLGECSPDSNKLSLVNDCSTGEPPEEKASF
jgi:hypothetical protein